jgi:hypothetical protein
MKSMKRISALLLSLVLLVSLCVSVSASDVPDMASAILYSLHMCICVMPVSLL